MIIFREKLFRQDANKALKNKHAMESVAETDEEILAAGMKYPIIKGGTYNDPEYFLKENFENRNIANTQTELIQKARRYGINDSAKRKTRSLESTEYLISKEARRSKR